MLLQTQRIFNKLLNGELTFSQLETQITGKLGYWEQVLKNTKNSQILVEDQTAFGVAIASSSSANIILNSNIIMRAASRSSGAVTEIINNATALGLMAASTIAMNQIANSTTAMRLISNSTTAMTAMVASVTAMTAMFDSLVAKTELFKTHTALIAMRYSATAMNYLDTIATQVTDSIGRDQASSPSPLNTTGSWFVIKVPAISSANNGGTRIVRNYKTNSVITSSSYNSTTLSTNWTATTLGLPTAYQTIPSGTGFSANNTAIEAMYFTSCEFQSTSGATATDTMTIRYINMAA